MKILVCCPLPWVDPKFGASRVAIDLVDGFTHHGIDYTFFPPEHNSIDRLKYADVLSDYLIEHAHEYDVVDYPFHVRPWVNDAPRANRTLKVARVVLLPHLEDLNPDPAPPDTLFRKGKRLVKKLLGRPEPTLYSPEIRAAMDTNMHQADVINVANSADKACLVPLGFPADKILVLPYGLTESGAEKLLRCTQNRKFSGPPRIAFVGTFDFRKGCLDFPEIVERVARELPEVRFRLLGTRGMMQTKEKVLSWFPHRLHKHLEIHPTFHPDELPELLSECHAGMFPSYREGFGIAVVEKLGAGLPVIAYDAPGPCDILPNEWLVQPGDKTGMAEKLIGLLRSNDPLIASQRAVEQSRKFDWNHIALETYRCYESRLAKKN